MLCGRLCTDFEREGAVQAARDVLMETADQDEYRRVEGFQDDIVRTGQAGARNGRIVLARGALES